MDHDSMEDGERRDEKELVFHDRAVKLEATVIAQQRRCISVLIVHNYLVRGVPECKTTSGNDIRAPNRTLAERATPVTVREVLRCWSRLQTSKGGFYIFSWRENFSAAPSVCSPVRTHGQGPA